MIGNLPRRNMSRLIDDRLRWLGDHQSDAPILDDSDLAKQPFVPR
jgi:hypothetical protein